MDHPHDEHLRLAWKLCRFGVSQVEDCSEKLKKVLAWLDAGHEKFKNQLLPTPQFTIWKEILLEKTELRSEITQNENFFSLSSQQRNFWRPLIQSQPFTCILPGKTTRERRAILSRLP